MSIMSFDVQARSVALWVSLAVVSIYAIRTLKRPDTHRFPPGPKGFPFLGPQLSKRPWLDFEIFKKQHGTLTSKPSLCCTDADPNLMQDPSFTSRPLGKATLSSTPIKSHVTC